MEITHKITTRKPIPSIECKKATPFMYISFLFLAYLSMSLA
jgi:hypothetical protein